MAVNQCFAPDTPVYTSRGVLPIRRSGGQATSMLGKSGIYREVHGKARA